MVAASYIERENQRTGEELEKELDRIRAEGGILELSDFRNTRAIPSASVSPSVPEQSAVALLMSLEKRYPYLTERHSPECEKVIALYTKMREWSKTSTPMADDDVTDLRALMEEQSELLDDITRLSSLPASDIETILGATKANRSLVLFVRIPHILAVRMCMSLCSLRMYLHCVDGEGDDALALCGNALKCASHVRDIPTLTADLMGAALINIPLENLPRLVSSGDFSDEAIEAFIPILESAAGREAFAQTIDAERFGPIQWFNRLDTAPRGWAKGGDFRLLLYTSPSLRFLRYRDELVLLELMRPLVEAANRPFYEVWPALEEWEKLRQQRLGGGAYPATKMFISEHLGKSFNNQAFTEARIILTRTLLALYQYHKRQGAYPENLDGLVPAYLDAVSTDPFSGQPLVYRREGMGYVLYSIGEDCQDDNGLDDLKEGDIVWRMDH